MRGQVIEDVTIVRCGPKRPESFSGANLPRVGLYESSHGIFLPEPRDVEQVSKTVNVIDGQEMRDRADFSLVETLRTMPGFRVQQLGGFR